MAKSFLVISLLFFSAMMAAQEKRSDRPADRVSYLRFNATGLIDLVDPNLSIGYEHRYNKNWAMSVDAGWIFFSRYYDHVKRTNGIIVRPAIRHYFGRSNNGFLELELHYKRSVYRIEDWLGRDCVNDVSAYEELTTFNYLRQVLGFHLKLGGQAKLSRNGRLALEYYFGLGARWSSQKVLDEPTSCYKYGTGVFGQIGQSKNRATVGIPAGVRLLYSLKK